MAPSVVRLHWLYASKSLASKDFIVVNKGSGFVVDCALARMPQTADRTTRKRGSDFLTFRRLLRQNAQHRSIRIARNSCSRNDVTSPSLPYHARAVEVCWQTLSSCDDDFPVLIQPNFWLVDHAGTISAEAAQTFPGIATATSFP